MLLFDLLSYFQNLLHYLQLLDILQYVLQNILLYDNFRIPKSGTSLHLRYLTALLFCYMMGQHRKGRRQIFVLHQDSFRYIESGQSKIPYSHDSDTAKCVRDPLSDVRRSRNNTDRNAMLTAESLQLGYMIDRNSANLLSDEFGLDVEGCHKG